MGILSKLLGRPAPAAAEAVEEIERRGAMVCLAGDTWRIEPAPKVVQIKIASTADPADFTRQLVGEMQRRGVPMRYLERMIDAVGTKIGPNVDLVFHAWKSPERDHRIYQRRIVMEPNPGTGAMEPHERMLLVEIVDGDEEMAIRRARQLMKGEDNGVHP
jgi:hypothetical protein